MRTQNVTLKRDDILVCIMESAKNPKNVQYILLLCSFAKNKNITIYVSKTTTDGI